MKQVDSPETIKALDLERQTILDHLESATGKRSRPKEIECVMTNIDFEPTPKRNTDSKIEQVTKTKTRPVKPH